MAKGEGAEQYSNTSLLNKPAVSSDAIKLAGKVSSFIGNLSKKIIIMGLWRVAVFYSTQINSSLKKNEIKIRFMAERGNE